MIVDVNIDVSYSITGHDSMPVLWGRVPLEGKRSVLLDGCVMASDGRLVGDKHSLLKYVELLGRKKCVRRNDTNTLQKKKFCI